MALMENVMQTLNHAVLGDVPCGDAGNSSAQADVFHHLRVRRFSEAGMNCYRVANWSKHFENNRTRELKHLDWVPIPNKHDGDGYAELVEHPDGAAHYGAWCVILQVASKCAPRGTLMRDSRTPHDSLSLSRKTRLPQSLFDAVLPRLVSIGWLETYDIPAPSCGIPAPSCASRARAEGKGREQNGTEQNGTEQNGKETTAPPETAPADAAGVGRMSLNDQMALQLANTYRAHSAKKSLYDRAIRTFREALEGGMNAGDIETAIMAADKLAPPWEIIENMRRAKRPPPFKTVAEREADERDAAWAEGQKMLREKEARNAKRRSGGPGKAGAVEIQPR